MASKNRPTLSELRAGARVVSLPLRTKFRGLIEREVMLFEGPNGWTEWSPFLEYEPEEAATWLEAAIEFGWSESPAFGSLAGSKFIRVNATLPAIAPEQVESVLSRFGEFQTVKIKVAETGQDLNQDLARIAAVRQLHPNAKLRLDANGGLSVNQARALAAQLVDEGAPIEYLEQPVATVDEMAELRMHLQPLSIKIAADENVRKASDPIAVARAQAADILVLKVAPVGGIRRAVEIAAEAGLPVAVSSAMESSVGLSMGAHLAASLPDFGFDAGLGTAALMAADVTRDPLKPINGQIELRRIEVDPVALDRHKAEDHRSDWWFDRLDRAWAVLENQD